MTRSHHKIVARHPLFGLLIMLLISLVANYLCADLRFFHYLQFSQGITANSPWFWVIFGGFLVLMVYCLVQIVFRPALLKADLSGLQLGHRALRGKIRVPWEDVREITRGHVSYSTGKRHGVMPAVRFILNTRENLGGVISNMTHADGATVCFAGILFEEDVDDAVFALREIQTVALGRPLKEQST